MENIIEIKNLDIIYSSNNKENSVIDNVSININKNDFISIIGETGSGKTTLAKAIIGLLPENAIVKNGKILYNNFNLCKDEIFETEQIRGNQIGIILQNSLGSLNPTMKIGKQIRIVLQQKYGKMKNKEFYDKVYKIFKEVELFDYEHILKSYPAELSGGMNQKINIALSLALEPKILICDEITSSLDANSQEEIIKLINKLYEKNKITVIFITHDILLANKISNRIVVLKNGKIVEVTEKINNEFAFQTSYAQLLKKDSLLTKKEEKNNNDEMLIEFKNVSKKFKHKEVFQNLNFTLFANDTLGIIGKTGCGKTTICKIITGIYKPNTGIVSIKDNTKIEMVFQNANSSLDSKRSVRHILNENNYINRLKKYDDIYLKDFLDEFNLPIDVLDRFPDQLSGGQKQKVSIIRALLNKPNVVIFDEPTSSLDVSSQKNVLKLLNNIKQKYKLTYIFISHNSQVIDYMCNKRIYLK